MGILRLSGGGFKRIAKAGYEIRGARALTSSRYGPGCAPATAARCGGIVQVRRRAGPGGAVARADGPKDPRTNNLIGLRLTRTHPDPEWSFSARSFSNGGMGNARHPPPSVLRFFSWCSSAPISASPLLRGEIAASDQVILAGRLTAKFPEPDLGPVFGPLSGKKVSRRWRSSALKAWSLRARRQPPDCVAEV